MPDNAGKNLGAFWLFCNNCPYMRAPVNMSTLDADWGTHSYFCSNQNNDTCKAVMVREIHFQLSSCLSLHTCLFFRLSAALFSRVWCCKWAADCCGMLIMMMTLTLITDERLVSCYFSLLFIVCNVVRCTQWFVGVTKLWHCEEQGLNTLAGDGHAVSQEGEKDGEDGHWEQVDVWFGIKDLVQSC